MNKRHTGPRALVSILVASLVVAGVAASAQADTSKRLLRELQVVAGCGNSTPRHLAWCSAGYGPWSGGTAAPIAAGDRVLIGVTVELEPGKVKEALASKVTLSALALRSDGTQVHGRITTITPSNAKQQRVIAHAVATVAVVLKGKSASAAIPKELSAYLNTLPKAANYPLVKREYEWFMKGASDTELRRVGDVWVAIERPTTGPKGIFVSVFTDKHAAR